MKRGSEQTLDLYVNTEGNFASELGENINVQPTFLFGVCKGGDKEKVYVEEGDITVSEESKSENQGPTLSVNNPVSNEVEAFLN
jgi:hypothetical protein